MIKEQNVTMTVPKICKIYMGHGMLYAMLGMQVSQISHFILHLVLEFGSCLRYLC